MSDFFSFFPMLGYLLLGSYTGKKREMRGCFEKWNACWSEHFGFLNHTRNSKGKDMLGNMPFSYTLKNLKQVFPFKVLGIIEVYSSGFFLKYKN